jgi:type II secretory pathway pseudopilin PulG
MITVAIIGILAAVAIPVLSGYITQSKASETANVLHGIRLAEARYDSKYGRYSADLPWAPLDPSNCNKDTVYWTDHLPADSVWYEVLGAVPDGPTYYSYRVTTNYTLEGDILPSKVAPIDKGTSWPGNLGGWFMAEAEGDVDCDDRRAHFYVSSHNKNVWHQEEALDTMPFTY